MVVNQCGARFHAGDGSCDENTAAESFPGLLKRGRVSRRRHGTRAEAKADVF